MTTTTPRKPGRPRKTPASTPVPVVSTAVVEATGEAAEPQPKQPLTAQEMADALAALADAENLNITLRMINWDSPVPEVEVYNVVDVLPSGTLLWKRYEGEEN